MRMRTAFWVAALTFSMVVSGTGVCFAQSGVASASEGAKANVAQDTANDVVVAAILPDTTDQVDAQTGDAGGYTLESAVSETADPAAPAPAKSSYSKIGIGFKASTLGAGIEVATPLTRKFNVRGGFNMFRYSKDLTNKGIVYNANLQFQSAEAHLDYFPFGGFHISPGLLFYNGNQITANAKVTGSNSFTIGNTAYYSDLTTPNPLTLAGKIDWIKVSPSLMLGVGNLIPRSGRHWSILFEVGAAYTGSARVSLTPGGGVCPTAAPQSGCFSATGTSAPAVAFQADVVTEQAKISKDLSKIRFYPIISLGAGFNF